MPAFPSWSHSVDGLSDRVFGSLMARARTLTGELYALHIGDTHLNPPKAALAEAQRVADHPNLHRYAPVHGEPRLLNAIQAKLSARNGHALPLDQIQVFAGATSGMSVVCQTLFEPGDEVILPSPYWPLIRGIITASDALPVEIAWQPNAARAMEQALERAVTSRTAALYINDPNNPTGHRLTEDEWAMIANFVLRHNLWLLVDYAYEDMIFDGEPPKPLWTTPGLEERTIGMYTVSKSYGMAGARIGYAVGPSNVMQAIRSMITFQTYGAAKPMQYAAAKAIESGADWIARAKETYSIVAAKAAEILNVPKPQSGTFIFMDVSSYLQPGESMEAFLDRCLARGLLLTPGSACGRDWSTHIRICFTVLAPERTYEALERLVSILKAK